MNIIRELIEIILRKRQPQDLSYSLNAAIAGFIGVFAIGYVVYSSMPQLSQPVLYNAAMTILQGLGVYAILAIHKKGIRFVQTITAIFGVSVILQLAIIASGLIPILAPLSLFLTIWNFVLIIFILRAALECSSFKSAIFTIAYHLAMGTIMVVLFPQFPQELQAAWQAALETASQAANKPS